MNIPKRVADRFVQTLKAYQAIVQNQKARDVSEADTVTVAKDILSEVFGFDKYAELTSEHNIRGTFCDLAVKIDNRLVLLIEVKAIGVELKEAHVKQAIDYAANQGCEWVVLTNAIEWRLYHVVFKKPIDKQEITCFSLQAMNPKNGAAVERLCLRTREGFGKNALSEFRDRKDATSRYMLAAILLNSDPVRSAIKREIRRVSEISVDDDVIDRMLREEVIKRDAIEGPQADQAGRRVNRGVEKAGKKDKPASPAKDDGGQPAQVATSEAPAAQ